MAVADYFERSALAASQVISGFDADRFAQFLERAPVEISISEGAAQTNEGRATADLVVRLLARFYPNLVLKGPSLLTGELGELARRINPRISLDASEVSAGIVIGEAPTERDSTVYVGSDGWSAFVSDKTPQPVGDSKNPFGPGIAACLAAARVFRRLMLGHTRAEPDVNFSVWRVIAPELEETPLIEIGLNDEAVVVGLGAIGSAFIWALGRVPISGRVHLVDDEYLELSNLQRYVLSERGQVGSPKVDLAGAALPDSVTVARHRTTWQEFLVANGYAWGQVVVALDTVDERRDIQASLPQWIANAWTQNDDLGLSTHHFGGGPCLACVYLPSEQALSLDEIIARDLRIDYETHKYAVRDFLARDAPPSDELLKSIANGLGVPLEGLNQFRGKSLRLLHSEGVCGGTLVSLTELSDRSRSVHVPLAHHSALAGILLAAAFTLHAAGIERDENKLVRINPNMALSAQTHQRPQARDASGRCICRDDEFVRAYREKYKDPCRAPAH